MVSTGYKGPKIARGLHPSGYHEVLVHNVQEASEVDPNTQAIRIAHTVGKKKRADIIAEARKKKITVLNAKEVKEEAEGEETTEEAAEKEPTEEQELEEKEAEKPKGKPAAGKKSAAAKAEKPKANRKSTKTKEEEADKA